jgi:hypothetical protein
MKLSVVLIAVVVSGALVAAQSRSSTPSSAAAQVEPDVIYEGELENYIAVGGESTGWRLRTRTPEGRRRYIEVLLTAEVAQGVRANTRVRVRGVMKTRRYPERGDVPVLAATEVIEVARTR